jgi:DNA-binding TFAR19-related protein (PDSD5 family)
LPYSIVNNPQHWRDCAEQVRAMVENVIDPGAKETLLKVAASYDDMAKKAEQSILWVRPEKQNA